MAQTKLFNHSKTKNRKKIAMTLILFISALLLMFGAVQVKEALNC